MDKLDTIKIRLYELLKCFSNAQDLVSPLLTNHHKQVAYLSFRLAQEIKLPIEQQKDIFLAALVHDIGALSINERLEIIENEPAYINNHAFIGAKLIGEFKPLQNSARIIKFHHLPWENGKGSVYNGENVQFGSHIIHLADRVCLKINPKNNVLSQVSKIIDNINKNINKIYEPNLVHAMTELSKKEYIWLDLISSSPVKKIDTGIFDNVEIEIDDVINLALIFSQIIDFRSSFTAQHSAGVAKTAQKLAEFVGFSEYDCKVMLAAGYLHDLGKLAINNSILEKPNKLNEEEFNEIRTHTYYTYQLLNTIPQFQRIKEWASYHHERLDGNGYPFHLKGDSISLGSRIMAAADVFTAIKENRPYRKEMSDNNAVKVLNDMVNGGALDEKVVGTLVNNFKIINEVRENAQYEASERYKKFYQDSKLIGDS